MYKQLPTHTRQFLRQQSYHRTLLALNYWVTSVCVCNIHIHVKSVVAKSTNKRFHTYHSATGHDAMQQVQSPLPCFHLTQQYARSLRVAIVNMLIHDNRRTQTISPRLYKLLMGVQTFSAGPCDTVHIDTSSRVVWRGAEKSLAPTQFVELRRLVGC